MGDAELAEVALERYAKLQPEFEQRGGYIYELRIRQTLTGLGFEPGDFHRPLPQLSGGQRTRAVLARLLLSNPDLLVLDEPTNHLDIQAVEWLEGYLSQWAGATLIVSHDRYFLDRVVDHIWEMRSDRPGSLSWQLHCLYRAAPATLGVAPAGFRSRKSPPGKRAGLYQAQYLRSKRAAGQRQAAPFEPRSPGNRALGY